MTFKVEPLEPTNYKYEEIIAYKDVVGQSGGIRYVTNRRYKLQSMLYILSNQLFCLCGKIKTDHQGVIDHCSNSVSVALKCFLAIEPNISCNSA